jgi:hypothetical protein
MKLSNRLKWCLAATLILSPVLRAQVTFLELDQQEKIFNRVQEGAGLMPGTGATKQFETLYSFSSSLPISGTTKVEAPSSDDNKLLIGHIRVGATLYGRFSSFRFGQVLTLPITDADGVELDTLGKNASDYWDPRPFQESDRLGYFWDENRKRVLSTGAGTFNITWRKAQAEPGQPEDYVADPTKYYLVSGVYYRLYTHTHAGITSGSAIAPPSVEADGATDLGGASGSYWDPKPHDLRATERYHYSESANAVFATQPGPVTVTWREMDPSTVSDLDDAGRDYITIGSLSYGLFSKRYIISGSPVKTPKTIYWTEVGNQGIPVSIPTERVSEVKIVYNSDVPENVPVAEGTPLGEGSGIGSESSGSNVNSAITGTLWYSPSDKVLKALNRQGRLFVEFLGSPDSLTGIPEYLGFEVVDIVKQPTPVDESVELGDPLPVLLDPIESLAMTPRLVNAVSGDVFVYRHFGALDPNSAGDLSQSILYARRETVNVNDLLVWWLETGVQGTLWPNEYVRYDLDWPAYEGRYSHYVRPLVNTDTEALETSVQLNGSEVPAIEFQDALDKPRAKITADFRFYTHLSEGFPSHRTLLRYLSGDAVRFERVFSWLDSSLVPIDESNEMDAGLLEGSVATQLDGYDSDSNKFTWSDASKVATTLDKTIYVGDRLTVPTTAFGSEESADYWAGYLNLAKGDSINPNAYVDPFVLGFEEANRGSIIPVNVIPGDNELEVMWFRRSDNDETDGFTAHYWPSVLGRYTIEWPPAPAEIVLASNDGSGPLPSLLARGAIYYENDKTQIGYNPNEEHALVQGGQAFALRDDLNVVTNDSGEYSSDPYVLLEYEDSDERLSMRPFKVLREDVGKGIVFNYPIEAGTILQAPMPLPLMDLPLSESDGFNVTQEGSWVQLASSDLLDPASDNLWDLVSSQRPILANGSVYYLQSPDLSETKILYVKDSSFYDNSINGLVADGGALLSSLSRSDSASSGYGYTSSRDQVPEVYFRLTGENAFLERFNVGTSIFLYSPTLNSSVSLNLISKTGSGLGTIFRFTVPLTSYSKRYLYEGQLLDDNEVSDKYEELKLLDLFGGGGDFDFDSEAEFKDSLFVRYVFDALLKDAVVALAPSESLADSALDDWYLNKSPIDADDLNLDDYRSKFTFQDRKGNLWIYRGPHDQMGPTHEAAFDIQFYYKTLAGFYFPSETTQPQVGTIVPYLRGYESGGDLSGEATGNGGQALAIGYQPYWPDTTPELFTGETLTNPKRGLPAVRGQISAEVIYQQSERRDAKASVVLHDPTRDKSYPITASGLPKVPGSAVTESYLGKLFFSLLPPHLGSRFFFDGSRGEDGEIVLRGTFVDETLGEDYLLLNVLSANDMAKLKALVVDADEDKDKWDAAIDGLATTLETFIEDVGRPGTYTPNIGKNQIIGIDALAAIGDDDIAADSYALSAVGPGAGFVTLLFGNGEAFTPVGDPVVMQVVQVIDDLYRGEVKPIQSSNPLNEQLTMQQISDFAGMADDYEFEWLIASPVDGLPPVVTESERVLLLGEGSWSHLRFPTLFDSAATVFDAPAERLTSLAAGSVKALELVAFSATAENGTTDEHEFTSDLAALTDERDQFIMRNADDVAILARSTDNSTATVISLEALDEDATAFVPVTLEEQGGSEIPASIVTRSFTTELDLDAAAIFLSMDLDSDLGARVFFNGVEVVLANMNALDDSLSDSSTTGAPAGFLPLANVFNVPTSILLLGTKSATEWTHTVAVELYTETDADESLVFDLRIEAFNRIDFTEANWIALDSSKYPDGVRTILGEVADVRALADNYVVMRYRPTLNEDGSTRADDDTGGYSQWTTPALAEGWIKRVLAGINPFNQRVTNLFSNSVDTDTSVLTEAGPRWEGDVALNLSTINNFGLIEIYETVLNRGRMLSIDAGINFGPANDALLLATGYLSDLYMLLGDEAKADALNPTIGIGTADNTYGDIATSMFSFTGQVATLLEEELALWRGRADFLQPGVEISPVYNRLVWNYTRGIDSGEVIYSLNYNINERDAADLDGKIDAADAAELYPQGHGDAYGHYLTAVKGYYKLFMDEDFTWVPRIEAVNILGVPVSVDYQDERKFAAAAVEHAKSGQQVLELTWREDFENVSEKGWAHFSDTRTNTRRSLPSTRHWSVDHWASRTQQSSYLNWVVGNAMLPPIDEDPSHEGIQRVDRTTVTELPELTFAAQALRASLDNAEAGLNPLGLNKDAVPFDLNPAGFSTGNTSHFEQVYERAKVSLNNAVIAFDDAKDVTRLLRSEEDSINDFEIKVETQELSYLNELVEIYGTPYADDIGPGKTYKSGFYGPDLVNYRYVDDPTIDVSGFEKEEDKTYTLRYFVGNNTADDFWSKNGLNDRLVGEDSMVEVSYNLSPSGYLEKPDSWKGSREYAGRLQMAINEVMIRRDGVYESLELYEYYNYILDRQLDIFMAKVDTMDDIKGYHDDIRELKLIIKGIKTGSKAIGLGIKFGKDKVDRIANVALNAVPNSLVFGFSNGGDVLSAAKAAISTVSTTAATVLGVLKVANLVAGEVAVGLVGAEVNDIQFDKIVPAEILLAETEAVFAVDEALGDLTAYVYTLNRTMQNWQQAEMELNALEAKGRAIQAEREIFRKRAASIVQGHRTRNAAFRLFRDEKLERYKSLFDLAARYSFLAAQAFDYETGLLGTNEGQDFVARIIQSRALGVVQDGEPQFAGSNNGDPGLSGILAEMSGDWSVLKSRLGFNNPDIYGTTFSLRTENFRILPGSDGDEAWNDVLEEGRVSDLLSDPDVLRYAMQIDSGDGLPVPGIIIEFSTNITDNKNFMGRDLAAGDHAFSPTSFATKIFSSGIVLPGYQGMDDPSLYSGATQGSTSPNDPDLAYLEPDALSATPYIYLIPVGQDIMRTPPLGDKSVLRGWSVQDVTIPLPFNIGASENSSKAFYNSRDSLTEPLFDIRKHQAFRPVSSELVYAHDNGRLLPSEFTNSRLIGRSVWNTRWKIVIPGRTLLNDAGEGLDRFIDTVEDIKLHLETYSYSGN